ncbi:hypothetical protein PAHAL_6G188000 [Panicum hallii]|uniref:Uncharacterized protein n=1 Tax=Panicum hallii TaxID=206008 RepID=A0A2T8IGR6_9POAL|nr:hypothetical protein PAHAL_6G188000 [Panicum hallii]
MSIVGTSMIILDLICCSKGVELLILENNILYLILLSRPFVYDFFVMISVSTFSTQALPFFSLYTNKKIKIIAPQS